jgi:hypothetical protein
MAISISFTASCADNDGTTRELSSSATLDASAVTTGTQTVGNTYEELAVSAKAFTAIILHNTGTVDVSVRFTLSRYTTNRYVCYTVPADGVFVVPPIYETDDGPGTLTVSARTNSGTANIRYCIIR